METPSLAFAFPYPLWLIPVILPLSWRLYRWGMNDRRARLATVVAPRLREDLTRSVAPRKRLLKTAIYVLAVIGLLLAAARPQHGTEPETAPRESIDFLIALDLSRSMLAGDMGEWSRLAAAKSATASLLRQLPSNQRVGLIGFAGEAFLVAPATQDHAAVRRRLETLHPQALSIGGSDLARAIQLAERTFASGAFETKVLVLVTDGEELQGDAVIAATQAASRGMRIFTVGVGTSGGATVPAIGTSGGAEPVRNEFGTVVVSRLNQGVLQQIAQASGGFYTPLGAQGEALVKIHTDGLQPLAAIERTVLSRRPGEYFQWPLGFAILLFLAEMLINERRNLPSGHP